MIRTLPDDLPLDLLHLNDFTSYLSRTGWQPVPHKDQRTLVFTLGDPKDDFSPVVTLPAKEDYSNYKSHMAMATVRLADVEETTPQEVAQKILAVGQDVIALRLLLPPGAQPSLDVLPNFFRGLRNLVMYGASMEKNRRRFFERPFRVGEEQAQHFQFARTFQGSFGFTITSQVEAKPQQLALPMARRVVERITRGILIAKKAEQKQDPTEISQHFEQGFNANMCKAVVDMLHEMSGVQMEYAVSWSCHLAPSADVAQIAPVVLEKETAKYLQEAARFLEQTADQDFEEEKILVGPVINLNSKKPDEKIVTIATETWEDVSFVADPDQYALAYKALGEGRMLSVCGKLARPGKKKSWMLTNPHDLDFAQE